MSMKEQLQFFTQQFDWDAKVINGDSLNTFYTRYVLCGMGGSALGGRLMIAHDPSLPLLIHSTYGLPHMNEVEKASTLFILSSYSGNTEEILEAASVAIAEGLSLCIVTAGGALETLGHEHQIPMMLIPHTDVEPRMAIGYTMLALTTLMRLPELDALIRHAGISVNAEAHRMEGESIARSVENKVPFVYASEQNAGIAYFWKIAFNETSKIPSSYNVMPEICHNELSGFDASGRNGEVIKNIIPIFLEDDTDHPRVQDRMTLMKMLLTESKIDHASSALSGDSYFHKTFGSILTGVWAAITLADSYGVPDAKTPLIAEFKDRLREIPA